MAQAGVLGGRRPGAPAAQAASPSRGSSSGRWPSPASAAFVGVLHRWGRRRRAALSFILGHDLGHGQAGLRRPRAARRARRQPGPLLRPLRDPVPAGLGHGGVHPGGAVGHRLPITVEVGYLLIGVLMAVGLVSYYLGQRRVAGRHLRLGVAQPEAHPQGPAPGRSRSAEAAAELGIDPATAFATVASTPAPTAPSAPDQPRRQHHRHRRLAAPPPRRLHVGAWSAAGVRVPSARRRPARRPVTDTGTGPTADGCLQLPRHRPVRRRGRRPRLVDRSTPRPSDPTVGAGSAATTTTSRRCRSTSVIRLVDPTGRRRPGLPDDADTLFAEPRWRHSPR